MQSNLTVRIAGEGGEGVISTGELLTTAVARARRDVFTFRTYPAEIKGGPAMFQLRFADHPVLSVGTKLDVLLAFNEEAVDLHAAELKNDGLLVYDSSVFDPEKKVPPTVQLYGAPLTSIAAEGVGLKKSKNMVALALMGQLVGIPLEGFKSILEEKFGKKGEDVLEKNLKAIDEGYKWGETHPVGRDLHVPASVRKERKLIMSGNEAMSAGAMAAGCRYYAGYPITPASDILSFMEKQLPRFGGVAVQTEDEISAIASCVGASFAGAKALTATSGPGLSLMAEVLGLSSMTETPVVIVDAQRSGPSTGMPTKTEQSDLAFAVNMGHGDAPRVVMAPSNVKDCFYGMVKAFYIAEKYQIPVVMLSDQSLSHRTQTFTRPNLENLQNSNRLRASKNGEYKRFLDTENGVSPVSFPGDEGLCYVNTGLEHDELGHPSWSPSNHQRMSAKRHRKLDFIAKEKGFTRLYGDEHATVGVICWGSTEGPVEEAIGMAAKQGLEVKALTIKMIHPLPDEEIRSFLLGLKHVLVPEINFTGQLCQILRAKYLYPFQSFTKCNGMPFDPDEIFDRIEEVIRRA
ncbi:MAG: 2-oxoglutarate oxidoreductase subunit KorA [Elusimicrobia bacterium]|nr:2-oxoglutarate oxidoreductase subunit KorA [Elusimicrobiota bacterium]